MQTAILNMILQGSWMILLMWALRPILRRWVTPRVRAALWLIPALRLMLPISLDSLGRDMPLTRVSAAVEMTLVWAKEGWQAMEAVQEIPWGWIWLAGSALAAAWMALVNFRFARRMRPAGAGAEAIGVIGGAQYEGLGLWQGENACLFGVVRPRIVMPEGLDGETRAMVLRHEWAHYRRRDHWRQALGSGLLCIYWWNPLVWLGVALHRQDCEAACDRLVVAGMNHEERKAYGRALVRLADGMTGAQPALSGTARHMKRRILDMKEKKISGWKKGVALGLTAGLMLGTSCTALGEDSSIGIIGGADGPTSIIVSGSEKDALSRIGGADGPTAILVADMKSGNTLSVTGEMVGLARFVQGECQEMISTGEQEVVEKINEMMERAVETALTAQPGDLPEEFLLVMFQNEDGEMVMGQLYEKEGQCFLRLEGEDHLMDAEVYEEAKTLIHEFTDR